MLYLIGMSKPIVDDLSRASDCILHLRSLFMMQLDSTNDSIRALADTSVTYLNESMAYILQASRAASTQHTNFVLAPDTFNPFNLLDVEQSRSSYGMDSVVKTVLSSRHENDFDPSGRTTEERLQNLVRCHGVYFDYITFFLNQFAGCYLFHCDFQEQRESIRSRWHACASRIPARRRTTFINARRPHHSQQVFTPQASCRGNDSTNASKSRERSNGRRSRAAF